MKPDTSADDEKYGEHPERTPIITSENLGNQRDKNIKLVHSSTEEQDIELDDKTIIESIPSESLDNHRTNNIRLKHSSTDDHDDECSERTLIENLPSENLDYPKAEASTNCGTPDVQGHQEEVDMDADSTQVSHSSVSSRVDIKTRVYGLVNRQETAEIVSDSIASSISSLGSVESLPRDSSLYPGGSTDISDTEEVTIGLSNVEVVCHEVEDDPGENSEEYSTSETQQQSLLYPNVDMSIWLRSCNTEQTEPLLGVTKGEIPRWLNGELLRNGPGKLNFGPDQFEHVFDMSALLHRFHISDGKATYQNRFLRSTTFEKNSAAQRIVVDEFGTPARVPDPCQTIFRRLVNIFRGDIPMTDNAMISIYPYDDELYALTESPYLFRIDSTSLQTLERVSLSEHVCVVSHSAHPHVLEDGSVINIGQRYSLTGPEYCVVKFPPSQENKSLESTFARAELLSRVKSRWYLHPSYMHSFCVTDNYIILIEQPLCVSVLRVLGAALLRDKLSTALKWYPDEQTHFIVIDKRTGQRLSRNYCCEAVFFLHTINAYENDNNEIVLDVCCYKNADILHCLYIETLKGGQSNSDYAAMSRSAAQRFTLPLPECSTSSRNGDEVPNLESEPSVSADAASSGSSSGDITSVGVDVLTTWSCEIPRINYAYNGKKYRYFYAITSDVRARNSLIKVDTEKREHIVWSEPNLYPSEPIFVPRPKAEREDDGVLLSVLLTNSTQDNIVFLLILDASSMKEISRSRFECQSAVPKCLHGWFNNH